MAAGGRGLHPGSAPAPVVRGFSCHLGHVTTPPLNMAVDSVPARTLRPASVRVPVLVIDTQNIQTLIFDECFMMKNMSSSLYS